MFKKKTYTKVQNIFEIRGLQTKQKYFYHAFQRSFLTALIATLSFSSGVLN